MWFWLAVVFAAVVFAATVWISLRLRLDRRRRKARDDAAEEKMRGEIADYARVHVGPRRPDPLKSYSDELLDELRGLGIQVRLDHPDEKRRPSP